jgi:hypothetical protein
VLYSMGAGAGGSPPREAKEAGCSWSVCSKQRGARKVFDRMTQRVTVLQNSHILGARIRRYSGYIVFYSIELKADTTKVTARDWVPLGLGS